MAADAAFRNAQSVQHRVARPPHAPGCPNGNRCPNCGSSIPSTWPMYPPHPPYTREWRQFNTVTC